MIVWCNWFPCRVVGSGGDRDDLEPEQGLGGTVGRLEGEPVYRAPDREHGELVTVHLQEAQQDEQGTQGEGSTWQLVNQFRPGTRDVFIKLVHQFRQGTSNVVVITCKLVHQFRQRSSNVVFIKLVHQIRKGTSNVVFIKLVHQFRLGTCNVVFIINQSFL